MARALSIELLAVEFTTRYGGNIRVFLGERPRAGSRHDVDVALLQQRESRFARMFSRLQGEVDRWRAERKAFLGGLVRAHGRLRAKAFPGRAAILVKLLGLDETGIDAVFEKPGSLKIGHYVPGTRIPIRSDEELFALPDRGQPLLNLAWHIPHEIRGYVADNGYTGPVVDILSAADFSPQ
jgi:hypothetical protein